MWGAIIGGALGLASANKQSKAIDRANAANMASFNQYKPYVDSALSGGKGALSDVLNAGYYQGPTLAGPTAYQTGAANALGSGAVNAINNGFNIANATGGFGQNAADIYSGYQNLANTAANTDRMATANEYALDNYEDISNAVLRDDRRALSNTLNNINMAASGSGNMNSSRAGVADAIANRDFRDRAADVNIDIINSLRDKSLQQQAQQFADTGTALAGQGQANSAMAAAYNQGLQNANQGFGMGMTAGGALQGYDQAAMNDARANFEGNRDFRLNQYKDYMAGMLGRAPQTTNTTSVNKVDPFQSAIGGMMSGAGFQNSGGFADMFIGPQQGPMQPGSSWGGIF